MHEPNKRTVLVVEDEPATRYLLTLLLEAHEYRVVMASDGQDAIDIALKCAPDVILLDLLLPGVDGFEVVRVLADDAAGIPIIAMSAAGVRPDAHHQNVRAFLPKPSATELILQTIEDVLMPASGGDRTSRLGHQ
jgi:CheY-like chemotaxis protein